ncbi:DUF3388 domain-containing protein [Alicyclobacillus shizuokensis]|uniref:DUF3388 domain-containing protein n=1 Tax=Alicyclobacillus shizuokensis TaxID=392014 RepID=UPI000A6CE1C1
MSNGNKDSASVVHEFYLQYHIRNNRPGLLGDLASLLGMLGFNIVQLNDLSEESRGFLLQTTHPENVEVLRHILSCLEDVELAGLRPPSLRDRMSLRHGRFIERSDTEARTYRFVRDELGVLVDFLGEILKRPGHQVIGFRGQPRVGKTESIVASSVYANKRWTFISSTLLRQTILKDLPNEYWRGERFVYIIDGAVSTLRGGEQHMRLVEQVMAMPAPIVIEHPDIFVRHSRFGWNVFDLLIELRHQPDEQILYEEYEREAANWQE